MPKTKSRSSKESQWPSGHKPPKVPPGYVLVTEGAFDHLRQTRMQVREALRDLQAFYDRATDNGNTSNGGPWSHADGKRLAEIREMVNGQIKIWACRKREQKYWCDYRGPGDFMGHTCERP